MQTLRILIASSDRTVAKRIEGILLDACFERADVDCKHSAYLADVERLIRMGWPMLTILSPDNLFLPSGQRGFRHVMAESLQLIGNIHKQNLMPFIAFGVSEQDKPRVFQAGVEAAFGPFWDRDDLKSELERVLRLPVRVQKAAEPARWPLLSNLLRGLSLAK